MSNLFVYSANNPVNGIDPSGYQVVWLKVGQKFISGAIGGGVGGAVGGDYLGALGGPFSELTVPTGALVGGVGGALTGGVGNAVTELVDELLEDL